MFCRLWVTAATLKVCAVCKCDHFGVLQQCLPTLIHPRTDTCDKANSLNDWCCQCLYVSIAAADLSDRLADSERARDDALQKLDSIKRATARVEREWELERQQMQVRQQ